MTSVTRVHRDADAAASDTAAIVARAAEECVTQRGRFLLALSGGRTSVPLFAHLRQLPGIPWRDCQIFWADERCVPPDHEDSNYRLAKELLLDHVGVPATQRHRIRGETTPPVAAGAYHAELATFFGTPQPGEAAPTFDLVLLGVGSDGHTASLFPGGNGLTSEEWAVDVDAPATVRPRSRVTLTLTALRSARRLLVLATGEEKAAVVGRIFRRSGAIPPAGLLSAVEGVSWILDDPAAAELPSQRGP